MAKKLTAAAMATTTAAQTADQAHADTAAANRFAAMLRAYEVAHATGADTAAPLYTLAAACALSVLRKCVDPQRKAATTLEEKELAKSTPDPRKMVSNNGISPALVAVRRDIVADMAYLEKLTAAHNAAYVLRYNAAGDMVQEVADQAAEKAAAALQGESLGDGIDLVNAAAVAILEQTAEHATDTIPVEELNERSYEIVHTAWKAAGGGVPKNNRSNEEYARLCQLSELEYELEEGINFHGWSIDEVNARLTAHDLPPVTMWIESPYTLRRIRRRVLVKADDTAAWEEVETTPIREVYRAIRREVQNSRAMQTDPRNGYSYIEDTAADPDSTATETIYRRLHKWADLGGYTMTGHYDAHGNASRGGQYTTTAADFADYSATLAALNLTDRQAQIIRLRMSGYGARAIGTYLGVSFRCVQIQLERLRAKCEKIGFTPSMWAEMTTEK